MSQSATVSYLFNAATVSTSQRTENQTRITTTYLTIPKFDQLLEGKKRQVHTYDVGEKETPAKFRLKVELLGHDNDIVEVYYISTTPIFVKSILALCLKRFEERSVALVDYQLIPANKWQHLMTLLKRDILSHRDSFLIAEDELRLKFQFMETDFMHAMNAMMPMPVPESQLHLDLKHLLENGLFSDVTIKSADGIEYKVHKAVLCARSPVLKALFEHNMKESLTNIVESPLESDTMQEVLTFIYSDKVPRVYEIPEKLLAAADYYQLSRLKCMAEDALQKKLTVDNCINTLQLADMHSAFGLKRMALEFIKDGNAKHIVDTDSWNALTSVDLVKTIYRFIVSDDANMASLVDGYIC